MCPKKISLGVTGGIGSGKSFVCRLLEDRGIPVFYCDPQARAVMQDDETVRRGLRTLAGDGVYLRDGTLNKPLLREFMMRSPENVAKVNRVVHPVVREYMKRWITNERHPVVAVECALLFDVNWEKDVTHTILVGANESTRLERVMRRDGVDESTARKWMSWQLSEEERERRATFVIRNNGEDPLEPQIDHILASIR